MTATAAPVKFHTISRNADTAMAEAIRIAQHYFGDVPVLCRATSAVPVTMSTDGLPTAWRTEFIATPHVVRVEL